MINHVSVEGRLTSKPNISTAQSGQQVAHFTLASDANFKNRNGQTPTDFVSCVMFGSRNRQGQFTNRNVQALNQFVPKGGLISIEGKVSQSRYKSKKTGQMIYSQPVTVQSFNFLNTHVRSHGNNNQYAQQGGNQQSNGRFRKQPFQPQGRNQNPNNNINNNGNNKPFPSSPNNNNNNPKPNNPNQQNKKVDISDDDLPF